MRITHLSLTNFRNYTRLELSLPAGPILLHGDNAQGKTNLLESMLYLAAANSPYTTSDRQLVNWLAEDDPLPFTRISGEVAKRSEEHPIRIEIAVTLNGNRPQKQIRINGVDRRVRDLLGTLNVVLFLPRDLELIEGSPSARRRYLDLTLSQTDPVYAEHISEYERMITQRNALLRRISEGQSRSDELAFWDEGAAAHGAAIMGRRQRLLRELERLTQDIHGDLTGGREFLELVYEPGFSPRADSENDGQLAFDVHGLDLHRQLSPDMLAQQFRDALAALRPQEIARGFTTIGPHRDEMRFMANGRDLGLYGSRGQARTAVLALKLAELAWMRDHIGEWPVLLLDEVIAELDPDRRAYLLGRIDGIEQALLTTTEPGIFTESFLERATVWEIRGGRILN